VIEQRGTIRIIDLATKSVLPFSFLDIRTTVNDSGFEQGLLGMAFHPDYASNGYFFVNYTGAGGETFVARYSLGGNANAADPGSAVIFLRQTQPFPNHNGGMLAFRPNDSNNHLYVSLGDGGSGGDPGNRAQDLTTKLGKILRIDVSSVPADPTVPNVPASNPFVDGAGGDEDSIWVYGVRNPWRFSFDRLNGDMYMGDVGQDAVEEIDYQAGASAGGENYGWRLLEGSADFNCTTCNADRLATELPIHEYTHADGFSVTGGYMYRGSRAPSIYGTYFFADFNSRVWSFEYDGATLSGFTERTSRLNPQSSGISSFGEDASGELYLVFHDTGVIRRIVEINNSFAMPDQSTGGRGFLIVAMVIGAILVLWRRVKWASK
jgi:glucose/arabinose dehydrogenase